MTSADPASTLTFEPPAPAPGRSMRSTSRVPPRATGRRCTPRRSSAASRSSRASTACCSTGARSGTSTASCTARCVPVDEQEIPERFARAAETFERKLWREQLRDWDETFKPAAIKFHRELQAVDPDAVSDEVLAAHLDALPRPPLGDDLPAHALHRRVDAADRRLARARGRLDGPPAGRAAGPDARRGAGVRRRVRRARGAHRGARSRTPTRALCSTPTATPPRSSRRCARATTTPAARWRPTSTSSATACSTGSTSPGRYALEMPDALLRSIRVAVAERRARRRRRRGQDRRGAREGPGGAPRGVRRAARRGAADVPPARRARRLQRHLGLGAHAPRRDGRGPPAGGGRAPARRRAHHRRRLRRDAARCSPAPPSRPPTSSRRGTPTACRAMRSPRRACSARRRRRRRTRRGCRRTPARLMRAMGIALEAMFARPRRRTRRTCCAGWRPARASTKGPRAG